MSRFRRRQATLAVLVVVAYVAVPLRVSDFGLSVLNLAGISAIGALGLNLLTGYAGQISLGHAAFVGMGAYSCAVFGGDWGLPFPLWLALAGGAGALLGLLVSPFAVRFRSHTMVVVSLALVFVAQHVFRNWSGLTGGNAGRDDLPSPHLAGLDLAHLRMAGRSLTPDQGWFWLVWAVVAVVAVLVLNVVRGRPGRAMVAVRESEEAAEVMGVDVVRTKTLALAASGALAAVAGALYGSYKQYVGPEEWSLLLSVQYLAMVLIGGMGTVTGPILGALFVTALPRLADEVGRLLPFVAEGTEPGLTSAQLSQLLFGLTIVVFVVAEPRGVAAIGDRLRRRRGRTTAPRPNPV